MKCPYGSNCHTRGCWNSHPAGFVVVCRNDGECTYGNKCRYRHLIKTQVPREKRPLCKNGDDCKYGMKCYYRHCSHNMVDNYIGSTYQTCSECGVEKRRPEPERPKTPPREISESRSYIHFDDGRRTPPSASRLEAQEREHARCEQFYAWGCP